MFGRRKKDQGPLEDDTELSDELGGEPDATEPAPVPLVRPQGPWDLEDAPEDDLTRIDLGGLRVPVPPETELRVDVGPDGRIIAATLVRGVNVMQVNAFAAPRSSGIWAEIREELTVMLREQGGRAEEASGPHGIELQGTVPTEVPGQPKHFIPARFLGVDGPRWFLRALVTGPAATDAVQAAELEAAFRAVVVNRGTEAMAVRHPLPLVLPRQVTAQASLPADAGTGEGSQAEPPSLELPERGPEITERR